MEAMGEGVLGFFRQDKSQVFSRKSLLQCLRLCTFWTQAFLRTQKEIALSFGVSQVLCKSWSLSKLLVTDQAGEILSKAMGARLAAQGTR
jgi:hypothetical protein